MHSQLQSLAPDFYINNNINNIFLRKHKQYINKYKNSNLKIYFDAL
jgi:hypothetical protein